MPLPKLNTITYSLTLPSSNKEITYRPFTVEEERILLTAQESDDTDDILRSMRQIINNCVQTELDVMNLPTFDIEYFFLNIRAKSTGEQIELSLKHANDTNSKGDICEHKQKVLIDINEIRVHKNEDHKDIIELDDNISVKLKYPTVESMAVVGDNSFESFVKLLAVTIKEIYESDNKYNASEYSREELEEFVYSMNQKQIMKIQNFFDTMPVLRHDITYTCAKCKQKESVSIQGFQNFFL